MKKDIPVTALDLMMSKDINGITILIVLKRSGIMKQLHGAILQELFPDTMMETLDQPI